MAENAQESKTAEGSQVLTDVEKMPAGSVEVVGMVGRPTLLCGVKQKVVWLYSARK